MVRWKTWLFGALGAIGSLLLVLYAASVVRFTNTPLQLALLVFTALAALIGWLGLLVSWLTYRLEAGRVPKPDVRIIDGDSLVGEWNLKLQLYRPPDSIEHLVNEERERQMEITKTSRAHAPTSHTNPASMFMTKPTEEDWDRHESRVEEYLTALKRYLKSKALMDAFRSVSATLLLAFTNDRGGAPANGVLVRLDFPEGQGLQIFEADIVPDEPEKPVAPAPPAPRSALLDFARRFTPIPLRLPSYKGLQSVSPPRNVSPPTFGKGSIRVQYEIDEILHNVPEDNRDHPLIVAFKGSGRWEVPYEVHARNLQFPRKGKLVIEALFDEEPSGVGLPDGL